MQGWFKSKKYDPQAASKAMLTACNEGNKAAVEALIREAREADAKREDVTDQSFVVELVNQGAPILKAAEKGRFDLVLILIQNRANPNAQNVAGKTMLMCFVEAACRNCEGKYYNYTDKLEELFREATRSGHPINPDVTDLDGMKALMYANLGKHGDLVAQLFDLGAKPLTPEDKARLAKRAEEAIPGGKASFTQALRPLSGYKAPAGTYQPPSLP